MRIVLEARRISTSTTVEAGRRSGKPTCNDRIRGKSQRADHWIGFGNLTLGVFI